MSSFRCDRTKNMADLGISVSDWPIYKENLFLWNYYASWNQTLQEWCLKVLYKIFSFHFDGQKTAVTGNSCFTDAKWWHVGYKLALYKKSHGTTSYTIQTTDAKWWYESYKLALYKKSHGTTSYTIQTTDAKWWHVGYKLALYKKSHGTTSYTIQTTDAKWWYVSYKWISLV
jgi:hypothetical protein